MADFSFIAVDSLLFVTAKGAPRNIVELIYSVRTSLRSSRPDQVWTYDDDVRGKLEELADNVNDAKSVEAINDCIACLEGEMNPLILQSKWGTRHVTPSDEHSFDVEIFGSKARLSDEDSRRLLEHLNAQEPLQIMLRGHLWVELMITDVLKEALPQSDCLQKARLSFSQRVHLAAAMRLISSEDVPAYLKLNRMRNIAAHELDATIDTVMVQELLSTISQRLRYVAFNGRPDGNFPDDLRVIMATMVITLDGVRDRLVTSRHALRFWHEETNRVLRRRD